jgi:MFS family permease
MRSNVRKLLGDAFYAKTIMLWITFFLSLTTLYFLMSWTPKLIEDAGHPASVGRDAFFLMNLGGVLGIYLLGWMSTRWRLTNLVSLFLVAGAIGMVIFAMAPNQLDLLMVIIFFTGVLQHGGFTGLYATAAKMYPTEIRATGIGWAIGLGRSGAVAGPAVAGYLIAAGLGMSANFYVFSVPLAIGGLFAYFLKVR